MITPSRPGAPARALLVVPLVAALALGACGSSASTPASSTSAAAATSSPSAAGLTLADGWVKAAPSGMTALFGTLTNPTDQPVTIVSAATPAAGMVQLHEVVGSGTTATMRPKSGGFVVPAHGTLALAPGHDHIMLMDLKGPVLAGATITVTLTTSAGSTVTVTALGKDFAAGNESYAGSASPGMPGSMSPGMGGMAGSSMSGSPSA